MKWWKIVVVLWLYALAMFFLIKDSLAVNTAEINNLHHSLNQTKSKLEAVHEKVYENETWLAEIQADYWNMDQQIEAMNLRLR